MGERTAHAPGTFSWVDLQTTDQQAAKAFYGALFGWTADDRPVGDGVVYSMMLRDGREVAAISPQQQVQRDAGAPPAWNNYVTVADADATAAKAGDLGGVVVAPPFDVLTAGRMTVLQDPQGAFFMAWQPRDSIGAQLVNAPGALVWNDLSTPDVESARAFYSALFGWTIEEMEGMPEPYFSIKVGGRSNGGMRPAPDGMPTFWLPYFGVDDVPAAMARVEELGGSVHVGPVDIPMARFAVVQDPQGATFAIYAGALDD
jgi:predicted enzyme related to lactoylglutathione lyase